MKKILGFFAIVIVGLVIVVSMSLGSLLKSGIEKAGSSELGTPLTVGVAYISPLSGSASLHSVHVKNPQGFSDNDILSLGGVSIELELASLLTDSIHIKSVTVTSPAVLYELKDALNNVSALRRKLAVHNTPVASQSGTAESTSKKTVRIDRVDITAPTLRLLVAGVPQGDAQLTLPDIHLKDLGGKGQGITVEQASELVFSALLDAAQKADISKLLNGALKDQLNQLGGKDGLKNVGGSLKKLF